MRWIPVLVLIVAACSSPPTGSDDDIDTAPDSARFVSISSGEEHTCALAEDGRAWCWGASQFLQLGVDSSTVTCGPFGPFTTRGCSTIAVPASTSLRFRALTAGHGYTCGVAADDSAWCWGANVDERLGNVGSPIAKCQFAIPCSREPVQVTGNHRFRTIVAGQTHSCGVTTAGRGLCWGANAAGLLGLGSAAPVARATPFDIDSSVTWNEVAASRRSACGITTAGTTRCWGFNLSGVLGVGDLSIASSPVPLTVTQSRLHGIVAGTYHICGLDADNAAWCWGANSSGQLGIGIAAPGSACPATGACSTGPVRVATPTRFASLTSLGDHTCGLTTDGTAWCWGSNFDGRIGDGTTGADVIAPVPVSAQLRFQSISAGQQHTCGVTTTGEAWCWGYNGSRLGNGSLVASTIPVRVVFRR